MKTITIEVKTCEMTGEQYTLARSVIDRAVKAGLVKCGAKSKETHHAQNGSGREIVSRVAGSRRKRA